MVESNANQYAPALVSPPGDTLRELLAERGITQADLAARMHRPKKTINEIVQGKARITPETAIELERVLGASADFWNRRESQYRQSLAAHDDHARLARVSAAFVRRKGIKSVVDLGWVERCADRTELLQRVLKFFGVASPEQLDAVDSGAAGAWAPAFRRSPTLASDWLSVVAWLRRGEEIARARRLESFDAKGFRGSLAACRALTRVRPEHVAARLRAECERYGVLLLMVPEPAKARVCGATWWRDGTPVIQLSLRHKTDDHFWFTFFHEVGHVLLHSPGGRFVDTGAAAESHDSREREADSFAQEQLVPAAVLSAFLAAHPRTIPRSAIVSLAERVGVSPGIVLGQLQHRGRVPHSHFTELKTRYDWSAFTEG